MEESKATVWPSIVVWLVFTLAIVLVILRAFGVIGCSWWLATALIWAPAVLIILAFIICYISFSIQIKKEKKGKK